MFCLKTVKSRLFKTYLKRKKQEDSSLGWTHISEKKIIENCDSVGAHKVGRVVSFWTNFDPNFTDIWRA